MKGKAELTNGKINTDMDDRVFSMRIEFTNGKINNDMGYRVFSMRM